MPTLDPVTVRVELAEVAEARLTLVGLNETVSPGDWADKVTVPPKLATPMTVTVDVLVLPTVIGKKFGVAMSPKSVTLTTTLTE
jgi:hypothetical protein